MRRRQKGFALLTFYNSICVIIVDEIVPNLRVMVRCFFVNLELELAITHG